MASPGCVPRRRSPRCSTRPPRPAKGEKKVVFVLLSIYSTIIQWHECKVGTLHSVLYTQIHRMQR